MIGPSDSTAKAWYLALDFDYGGGLALTCPLKNVKCKRNTIYDLAQRLGDLLCCKGGGNFEVDLYSPEETIYCADDMAETSSANGELWIHPMLLEWGLGPNIERVLNADLDVTHLFDDYLDSLVSVIRKNPMDMATFEHSISTILQIADFEVGQREEKKTLEDRVYKYIAADWFKNLVIDFTCSTSVIQLEQQIKSIQRLRRSPIRRYFDGVSQDIRAWRRTRRWIRHFGSYETRRIEARHRKALISLLPSEEVPANLLEAARVSGFVFRSFDPLLKQYRERGLVTPLKKKSAVFVSLRGFEVPDALVARARRSRISLLTIEQIEDLAESIKGEVPPARMLDSFTPGFFDKFKTGTDSRFTPIAHSGSSPSSAPE